VYGLTKGQFSATADIGSKQKSGIVNELDPIDTCALAIELGCGFVARSFSGDQKQLVPLFKAALSHPGTAFIDVISPCVTFNNHEGSTKSYQAVKVHDIPLHELGFIPHYEPVQDVDYEPGTAKVVDLPDGSKIVLKKLDRDYDPTDKMLALETLHHAHESGDLMTGLFYISTKRKHFNALLELPDKPLALVPTAKLRPPPEALDEVMKGLM
jgi:2-oxoglutarate ferredoxin oxidoreductase subunit beta